VYLPQFQTVGRMLAESGLITGASGNLSIRIKDRLIITRHGSVLSELTDADLIETGIYKDDHSTPLASWELPVHRAIYVATHTLAVVHAHPPYAITLSLLDKPEFQGGIVTVGTSNGIVAGVLADEIACELEKRPLVMVRGHGSFAIGKTLEEACRLTLKFEEECKRICIQRSILIKQPAE
jgi:L-fuculose-phosphate aldolase